MAKKKSALLSDLEKADYMQILSGGGTSSLFTKNELIDYSYSSGIMLLDYVYGYEINIRDTNDVVVDKRTCLGFQAGSFNVITGRTQSFKTTIGMQIAANIAYANNGNVVHYDVENRLVIERAKMLSKLPEKWFTGEFPRYKLRSGVIGFDTLQNDITEIYENKMRHKDILLKDTGTVNCCMEPIKLMPPTVVFVDSLQDIVSEEKGYDVDAKKFDELKENRHNMYGAQSAKTIRGFIADILPMLKEANIMMFVIAHKTSNMSLNPFAPVKKQFQYGNHDERISGGSAVEFNASAVVNLTGVVKDDSRYNISSDGFDGNTVLFEPTKSSTNESGNEKTGMGFNIVIDKRKEGVDQLRTLVLFLLKQGRLKGNKAGYRLLDKSGNEISDKFRWKKIYAEFEQNQKLFKTFMLVAKEELETLISKSPDVAGTIKPFNMDDILNSLGDDE